MEKLATPDLEGACVWLGRTMGISSSCSSSPVYKGDRYLAISQEMGFSPGETLLCVSSLTAACLLCPVPPQHFYLNHSGHLELKGKLWSKCFGMAGCSLRLMAAASAEKNQQRCQWDPHLQAS